VPAAPLYFNPCLVASAGAATTPSPWLLSSGVVAPELDRNSLAELDTGSCWPPSTETLLLCDVGSSLRSPHVDWRPDITTAGCIKITGRIARAGIVCDPPDQIGSGLVSGRSTELGAVDGAFALSEWVRPSVGFQDCGPGVPVPGLAGYPGGVQPWGRTTRAPLGGWLGSLRGFVPDEAVGLRGPAAHQLADTAIRSFSLDSIPHLMHPVPADRGRAFDVETFPSQ
jgi:hypothetical protein